MDEKEKLVSLLEEGHYAFYENFDPSVSYMEALANHLLANGVVVSAPLIKRRVGDEEPQQYTISPEVLGSFLQDLAVSSIEELQAKLLGNRK